MKKNSSIRRFLYVFLLCVAGCDQSQYKTDSMLRSEDAHQQVQTLVEQANILLSAKVLAAPKQHLDTLVLTKKISHEAMSVFDNKNIREWQHDGLDKLQSKLIALQPELADYAVDLLIQVTEKTIALRLRLEEIKNVPYGAHGADVDKMVEYLSKEYNAEVLNCCLVRITRISELLDLSSTKYAAIIKLSRSIYSELEQIVRNAQAGPQMLERLEKISTGL